MSLLGEYVGHYQVEKLVTRYTGGDVYQAQDLFANRERVFLHGLDLPTEAMDNLDQLGERWSVLGYLQHAGLLAVRNYFSLEGRIYIVTDYSGGCSLKEYLDQVQAHQRRNIWNQAEAIFTYLGGFYGGYAHRNLTEESFWVAFDGSLRLLELGWYSGAFGDSPGRERDWQALRRISGGEVRYSGQRTYSNHQISCPGCGQKDQGQYGFCLACGFDLGDLQVRPLGLVLEDVQGARREIWDLHQLPQVYPYYRLALESATKAGSLGAWLKEQGAVAESRLLEGYKYRQEPIEVILAKVVNGSAISVAGSIGSGDFHGPKQVDMGLETSLRIALTTCTTVVWRVVSTGSKPGLRIDPPLFGGNQIELTISRSSQELSAGLHRSLVELEINNRREFIEVFFEVEGCQ